MSRRRDDEWPIRDGWPKRPGWTWVDADGYYDPNPEPDPSEGVSPSYFAGGPPVVHPLSFDLIPTGLPEVEYRRQEAAFDAAWNGLPSEAEPEQAGVAGGLFGWLRRRGRR